MSSGPSQKETDYLYSLANNGHYEKLVQYIRQHERESVRFGAAGVLSESIDSFKRHKTEEHQSELVRSVLTDPSDSVRGMVMQILLDIDESIADAVITRLELNPNSVSKSQPYPRILTTWNSSQYDALRYLAVVGFGRTASRSSVTKLRTKIIEEDNIRVLCRAIEESGGVGDEKFVTPIQDHLRADESEYYVEQDDTQYSVSDVKERAVDALVEIGTDAAYEALVTSTRSTDFNLRQHAIKQIGRFGAQDTVEVVVEQFNEEDEELREDAAEGVITAFTESDFDEGGEIRDTALDLISEDVSVDVSTEFASIVEESSDDLEKRNAAWLLGEIDEASEEGVDGLLSSLTEDDDYLRRISAASLSKIGDRNKDLSIDEKIVEFRDSLGEDSDAHELCDFLEESLSSTAEEAKKNVVEYSYVTDPSDYTTQRD